MAGPLVYTDDVKIDFGCPFPRDFESELLALPGPEAVALARYKRLLEANHEALPEILPPHIRHLGVKFAIEKAAEKDPIQFGWTMESWREIMENWAKYDIHCVFGGNRSSKSVCAARLVLKAAMEIPEARIYCFQVNDEKSRSEQQAYIWEALPDRFKTMPKKKGEAFSVQYTQQNGFVSGKLILPPRPGYKRGSEIKFMTYQQYRSDPQVIEGWWAHLIWCDEEVPLKMFERLLTRLYDARGRMLLTFTTIQGWSPLVNEIVARTRTIRKRYAKLLKRDIPVAQESLTREGVRIYYFWTQDNPFIPADTIRKLRGRPEHEILSVAYGIPTKAANACFTTFDPEVHVIAHERLPWLTPEYLAAQAKGQRVPEFTDYQSIDPAGEKPWFMIWGRVDARGILYIWAEWPDESFGPWAEPSDNPLEGKPGEGQRALEMSTGSYVEVIGQIEEGITMHERTIDPRLSVAKTPTREGATSILTELESALTDQSNPCDVVRPAPGLMISHGIQLIKDRLAYDKTQPISATNSPKLFISDRCFNLIDAFKNYTNRGSREDAYKDPMDTLRYMLENGAYYIAAKEMETTGQTFSY